MTEHWMECTGETQWEVVTRARQKKRYLKSLRESVQVTQRETGRIEWLGAGVESEGECAGD